ncbi:putative protein phosphatase 2C T23F11.1 [Orchesella cincta]|uniref:protein-serine/threonine phosphatase n=1 Tax=Orchesella cincta TaxID=48709 RepID=A0A1D2MV52_ORCCI|nr:putative protein phosphatase 2C T23F11.1 [Orchesella cincta]
MGQTLSEPVTSKDSESCKDSRFKVGSSCMQGWRVTMEDAHTHILSVPDDPDAAFFAVYDGHGGSTIAKHAGNHLHKFVVQQPAYKNGDIPTAFKKAFLEFDYSMLKDEKLKNEVCGTTAVTVLIKGNQLYCGNAGDSRAVACINGKCHPLSFDHKPSNPIELERIKKAGGFVEYNRVNGNLALSRALGDFVFKRNERKLPEEQMVTALPDVEKKTITEDWEFVILACDGIWDVVSNEEACEFIRYPLGTGMEPEKICEELMSACIAPDSHMGGLGCDNMTVVLVCFLHGKSWEQYCSKIASTLEPNLLGYTRRLRASSSDDSSDDNEDAILKEKLDDTIAVALSGSLSIPKSQEDEVVGGELPQQGEEETREETTAVGLGLQDAMQAGDYIHKGKGGQVEVVVGKTALKDTTIPLKEEQAQAVPVAVTNDLLSLLVEEVLDNQQVPIQNEGQLPELTPRPSTRRSKADIQKKPEK